MVRLFLLSHEMRAGCGGSTAWLAAELAAMHTAGPRRAARVGGRLCAECAYVAATNTTIRNAPCESATPALLSMIRVMDS